MQEIDLEAGQGGTMMAGGVAGGQAAASEAANGGGSVRGGTVRVQFAGSVGEGAAQPQDVPAGPRRAATDGGAPAAMQVDRSVGGSKRNAAAFKPYIKPSPSVAGLAQVGHDDACCRTLLQTCFLWSGCTWQYGVVPPLLGWGGIPAMPPFSLPSSAPSRRAMAGWLAS